MSLFLHTEFILYVADQQASKEFYSLLLDLEPVLDVPGMTEFQLTTSVKLGLMPSDGIAKIIQDTLPHPKMADGIPRCELYLTTDQIYQFIERAEKLNAKIVSPLEDRTWGERVVYFADPDGHLIAFAESKNHE
jgi:lactoylglutathione lyase